MRVLFIDASSAFPRNDRYEQLRNYVEILMKSAKREVPGDYITRNFAGSTTKIADRSEATTELLSAKYEHLRAAPAHVRGAEKFRKRRNSIDRVTQAALASLSCPSSASTNSSGENSCRSSGRSPSPTKRTGSLSASLMPEDHAALCRAVELGQHDTGELERFLELRRLSERVLSVGRVDHEQGLVRGARPAPWSRSWRSSSSRSSGWSWCAGGPRCRRARRRRRSPGRASMASKMTLPGSAPSLPRTTSQPTRSPQTISC